jgi:hypothetical protein
MSAKHTPGPWHCGLFREAGADSRFNGIDIGADNGANVALIHYQQHAHEPAEVKANASLIAAAPELLDALQSLIAEYEPNLKAFATDAPRKAKWEAACAAIAKATGEQA